MKKVDLSYNPFLKEVDLLVDGKKATLPRISRKELYLWAKDFYGELENKYNAGEYIINFQGIMRDYEFLEDALKERKDRAKFTLKGKENCIYAKNQLEKLKEIFAEIQDTSPYEQLKSDEIKNHFEMVTSNDFEIAVVATMSSGKSTLINAMLGRELLPARNEATTATIAKIYDEDGMANFTAIVKNAKGEQIQTFENFTLKEMEEVNTNGNKKEGESNEEAAQRPSIIEIHGDIVGIDSSNIRLVLSDTPGPNNSQSQEHKEHTHGLLNKEYKPMILYVLNATQIATNDDNLLLQAVSKAMQAGGRQSQERFMFILNKADALDPDKGETIENVIQKIKIYLEKHNIYEARIFPVSSLMAKIIRQYLNKDELTRYEKTKLKEHTNYIEYKDMHFEKYAPLSDHSKAIQDKLLKEAQDNPYKEALIHTGIVSIELAMSEYIQKYALPVKVSEGVASFKEKLDNLGIEAKTIDVIKENKDKIEDFLSKIDFIEKALQNGDKAKNIIDKIKEKSFETVINDELNNSIKEFNKMVKENLSNFNQTVAPDVAKTMMDMLNDKLESHSSDLKFKINNILENGIKHQAEKYVQEYQEFVEDLVGEVKFDMGGAATVLGDLSSINTSQIVNEFSKTESVPVGEESYEVSDSTWYKPWTWGDTKTRYRTIYKYQELVNLQAVVEDKILPSIQDFMDKNRENALIEAKDQEDKFKAFFLNQFEELQSQITAKLDEQKNILNNKEKCEAMIKENEKNLSWLNSIKTKLDNILSIKEANNA